MGTKLYVGNLSFNTTETDLQDLFAQAGAVQDVMLMQDKFTGKSRGFAFVTMTSDEDAQNAIKEFNGKTVEGRPLTVNEARPREARPAGGGGGGYGGGGGGGGGRSGGGGYGGGGGGRGGGGGYGGGGGGRGGGGGGYDRGGR
jgi:RNA recognition motif-containing protein